MIEVPTSSVAQADQNDMRATSTPGCEHGCAGCENCTDYDEMDLVCHNTPPGWRCTRGAGHEGPCAAVEAPEEVALVARGMQRLREKSPAWAVTQAEQDAMSADQWAAWKEALKAESLPANLLQQALEALESCGAAAVEDGGQQWFNEALVDAAHAAISSHLAASKPTA